VAKYIWTTLYVSAHGGLKRPITSELSAGQMTAHELVWTFLGHRVCSDPVRKYNK